MKCLGWEGPLPRRVARPPVCPRTRRPVGFAPFWSGCCGTRRGRRESRQPSGNRRKRASAHAHRVDASPRRSRETRFLKYQPRSQKATEKGCLTAIAAYVKHNGGAGSRSLAAAERHAVWRLVAASDTGTGRSFGGGRRPPRRRVELLGRARSPVLPIEIRTPRASGPSPGESR